MAQHFLLSAKARTLSIEKIIRMSDEEAFRAFCAIRWAETEGQPVCVWCSCAAVYEIKTRWKFKCQACLRQFSPTSRTIFADHKLPLRTILRAIAMFVNAAKGYPALHMGRDLEVQSKTAFVLLHKLREVMSAQQKISRISGEAVIDGAYFGGYVKPANLKANRIDRRLLENRSGLKQCVVVVRERGGRSIPFVGWTEQGLKDEVIKAVEPGQIVYSDLAPDYDGLHAIFQMRQVNHDKVGYSDPETGYSSNEAEWWFSRARRMEQGIHHHIAGYYLLSYMREIAWREDRRRMSNGEQFLILAAGALHHGPSPHWKGYWQRRKDDGLEHNRRRPKLQKRRNFSPRHVEKPYHKSRTIALDGDPA